MDLDAIRAIARQRLLIFTEHAIRQMIKRQITDDEVRDAILSGEIIENYPDDKYSPSCLVFGRTQAGRPLHVQCSAPPRVRVITVYQPDPGEWVDNRQRRKS
jgi:hypothetical protein